MGAWTPIASPARSLRSLALVPCSNMNHVMYLKSFTSLFLYYNSSAESKKGVIVVQRYSVENQKGAIAIVFVYSDI